MNETVQLPLWLFVTTTVLSIIGVLGLVASAVLGWIIRMSEEVSE